MKHTYTWKFCALQIYNIYKWVHFKHIHENNFFMSNCCDLKVHGKAELQERIHLLFLKAFLINFNIL